MKYLDDEEYDKDDLKSLAFTVAFFTLVTIGLVLLFVYAIIKFI